MEEHEIAALEEVKARVLESCRKNQLRIGHHLSQTQVQQIAISLNPRGQALLNPALQAFIDEGVFRLSRGETGQELELTELGVQRLYSGVVRNNNGESR